MQRLVRGDICRGNEDEALNQDQEPSPHAVALHNGNSSLNCLHSLLNLQSRRKKEWACKHHSRHDIWHIQACRPVVSFLSRPPIRSICFVHHHTGAGNPTSTGILRILRHASRCLEWRNNFIIASHTPRIPERQTCTTQEARYTTHAFSSTT